MTVTSRDEALDLFLLSRRELVEACREAMVALYHARHALDPYGARVSGDDATEWLDRQRTAYDPRLLGAVFRPRSGWAGRGWMPSRIPRRHSRPVKQWVWVGI